VSIAKAPKPKTLKERIKELAAQSAPSMIPVPREADIAPPEKEVEVIPSVAELIEDGKTKLELARMVDRVGVIGSVVSPLSKEKKKLVEKIKIVVGKYKIGKALSGEWRINYYNAPRKFLDPAKLMAIPPEELVHGITQVIINRCYSESASYTLRITKEGEDDSEE
jgi:hypothetical protein